MRFAFPRSHAFPRGRVIVDDDGAGGPECLVEFGDAVVVIAAWHPVGDQIDLSLPAYRTAKGNPVASRTWRLVRDEEGVWRSHRVS